MYAIAYVVLHYKLQPQTTTRETEMTLASANTVAMAIAVANGTLTVSEHVSRFGEPYWAVCDEHGLIEVFLNKEELDNVVGQFLAN